MAAESFQCTWELESEECTVVHHNGRTYYLEEQWSPEIKVSSITTHGLVHTLAGDVERKGREYSVEWSDTAYPYFLITIHFDDEQKTSYTYMLISGGGGTFRDEGRWNSSSDVQPFGEERRVFLDEDGETAMIILGTVPEVNDSIFDLDLTSSVTDLEKVKRIFAPRPAAEIVGESLSSTSGPHSLTSAL